MNYSKPLWQVERDLVKGVRNAFIQADNGQQCASMFDELDKSNPDIHEYINHIQQATGNDRYFCMLNLILPSLIGAYQSTFGEAMSRVTVLTIASMPTNSIRQSQNERLCATSVDKENRLILGLTVLNISLLASTTFKLVENRCDDD